MQGFTGAGCGTRVGIVPVIPLTEVLDEGGVAWEGGLPNEGFIGDAFVNFGDGLEDSQLGGVGGGVGRGGKRLGGGGRLRVCGGRGGEENESLGAAHRGVLELGGLSLVVEIVWGFAVLLCSSYLTILRGLISYRRVRRHDAYTLAAADNQDAMRIPLTAPPRRVAVVY